MLSFRLANIIILVTIGGCCAARSVSSSDSLRTVELNDKETHIEIGKFADFLEDPSHQLTLENVSSPSFANQFIRSNQNTPNFGFSPSDFWIRVKIKNNSSENHEWLLETGNPLISSVQLFTISDQAIVTFNEIKKETPVNEREVKDKRLVFELNIPQHKEQTLYIHVSGYDNKLFHLAVWDSENFSDFAHTYDVLLGLFFGILLALIFYNLFLFISILDLSYLFYVLGISGVMLIEMSKTGFGFQFLGGWLFNDYTFWVYIAITFIFGTLFSTQFLNVKQYYPLLNKFFNGYVLCILLSLGITLMSIHQSYFHTFITLISFVAICNALLLLITGVLIMMKGNRAARYFLISWSFVFLANIIMLLKHMNYVPVNWFTIHFMKLATTFEGLILSLGLADRFNTVSMNLKIKTLESERLAESEKMKSDFFSNISHELRTPLSLILSPLERMLSSKEDNFFSKQHQLMHRNAKRLLQLVNQLLYLTKLDSKSARLKLRDKDLIKELSFIASYFESLAEEKQITFNRSFPSEDFLRVPLDKEKLEMIIFNLLSNAFKFTPPGGHVSLSVTRIVPESKSGSAGKFKTTDVVKISVKDSGIGIAADQLNKIFDRFYQVNNSSAREYEGTGIGLSLVKELVDLHHGKLEVESEPGKGSEFIVYLPADDHVYKATDFVADDVAGEEELPYSYQIKKSVSKEDVLLVNETERNQILLIEDNPDFRLFTKSILEDEYEVIEAADGESGWKIAQEKIPDLIISDLMMPKMDGLEFCKNVKQDIRTSHIPLILLTARQAIDYKLKGLETGADDYIGKPFHVQELQIRIKNLIALREKLKEKYNKPTALLSFDIPVTSANDKFLQLLIKVIEDNLTSSDFDMERFSREVGMSRVQLFRKLKALTGQAPSDFIRIYKLNKAANLLSKKAFESISEVAYACGFNSPSYFTESFRKQFGKSPSDFIKEE